MTAGNIPPRPHEAIRFETPVYNPEVTITREAEVSGMSVEWVKVTDGFEAQNPKRREALQSEMDDHDRELRRHPEWQMPQQNPETKMPIVDPANKVSAWFYETDSQKAWGSLMPTALALYPLQKPDSELLPNGAPIDERARDFFMHSIDAIGIRTRAEIMSHLAVDLAGAGDTDKLRWVSIACGAAVPVLEAISQIKDLQPAKQLTLDLVDLDPQALAFAEALAQHQGLLAGRDFHTHQANIIKELYVRNDLLDKLGKEQAQLVDGLGIFEYFRDDVAIGMLDKMYQLTAPGGKLIIGNMLSDRRQLEFNRRAVGWPKIFPRSLQEIAGLVEASGLPLDAPAPSR